MIKTKSNRNILQHFCYRGFILSVFCILVSITPLHAQWMEITTNPHRTLSDSAQIIHFKEASNGLKNSLQPLGKVLKNINVSKNPEQVVITDDNKFAFIRCHFSDTVELIDIARGEIIKSFSIPCPYEMSISNDRTKLIVASLGESYNNGQWAGDCQMFSFINNTGKSRLTIIDIASQEIEHSYTIVIPYIRDIMNSPYNDTIYLRSDFEIIQYNIKDSLITRSWQINHQMLNAEIDNKNNRIFFGGFSDSLYVLILPNGPILSIPLSQSLPDPFLSQMKIDTSSNRVFLVVADNIYVLDPNYWNVKPPILVLDAISLLQINEITENFGGFTSLLALPQINKLYLGGGIGTLELDYLTLSSRKLIQLKSWQTIYNEKYNSLYGFQFGAPAESNNRWSTPTKLDITEFYILYGSSRQYATTESLYTCSNGRTIAISPDDNVVIVTNSPENTISILYLETNVGISSISIGDSLSVYPNPANDILLVNLSVVKSKVKKLNLFNSNGRLMFSLNVGLLQPEIIEIPVLEYIPGLYYLNLITEEGIVSRKVLILR